MKSLKNCIVSIKGFPGDNYLVIDEKTIVVDWDPMDQQMLMTKCKAFHIMNKDINGWYTIDPSLIKVISSYD